MSVNSIGGIQTAPKITNSSKNKGVQSEKKEASAIDKKKVVLALAGLAAVATIVAGVKIVKGKASADDAKKVVTSGIEKGKKVVASGIEEGIEEGKEVIAKTKDLTVDEFKKVGKFEKGKAFIDGKPYTGNLTTVNKKGETIDMCYRDGKICRAWGRELPNGNRASKTYAWNKNGHVKEIQIFDGTTSHGKYVTIKDNVITRGKYHGSTVQKSIKNADGTVTKLETTKIRENNNLRTITKNTETGEIIEDTTKVIDRTKPIEDPNNPFVFF